MCTLEVVVGCVCVCVCWQQHAISQEKKISIPFVDDILNILSVAFHFVCSSSDNPKYNYFNVIIWEYAKYSFTLRDFV